jgi:hypothetical protein
MMPPGGARTNIDLADGGHERVVTAAVPRSTTAALRVPVLSVRRRAIVWALVVGATVIALVSILTVWVNRQMLDNNAWRRASEQVIESQRVREALAVYSVNQLYENVDVANLLEARLPANLQPLAAPVAGALRQPATAAVTELLSRPRVQQLWINASTVAHEKLVNVLENKTGFGVSSGNGVVTVDLGAMVKEIGAELGLPGKGLAKLPPQTGVITVMRSDQLAAAQQGVRAVRILSIWLFVLVFGMYALAIYLASGARRVVLRNIGLSLVLTGLLVLIVRRLAGNYVIDGLTSLPYRPPVHDAWLIGTSILGQIGGATILYGLIVAAGAMLAGPSRAALWLRTQIAPTLNRRPGVAAGAVGFVYLLLVYWGGTHALRTWWGILLFAALLALGVVALRRQTLREFPDDRPMSSTAAEEIARLRDLRDAGAITQDEFARGKELALS